MHPNEMLIKSKAFLASFYILATISENCDNNVFCIGVLQTCLEDLSIHLDEPIIFKIKAINECQDDSTQSMMIMSLLKSIGDQLMFKYPWATEYFEAGCNIVIDAANTGGSNIEFTLENLDIPYYLKMHNDDNLEWVNSVKDYFYEFVTSQPDDKIKEGLETSKKALIFDAGQLVYIPNFFTKLTVLKANFATKIPHEYINLEELYADSAKEIPRTLINLRVLSANSAEIIPDTLVNLEILIANSAIKIPPELTKLRVLSANSVSFIPETLINLEELTANSIHHLPTTLTKLRKIYAIKLEYIPIECSQLTFIFSQSLTQELRMADFPNLKHLYMKVPSR